MSIRALCLGVVDQLKLMLGDSNGERCGYQANGDFVPPINTPFYAAVTYAGTTSKPLHDNGTNLAYSVAITFTIKASGIIADRLGLLASTSKPTPTNDARTGIEEYADNVADWFLQRYDVLNLANAKIEGSGITTNGFVEPFDSLSSGAITEDDGVLRMTVTLGGARRLRVR